MTFFKPSLNLRWRWRRPCSPSCLPMSGKLNGHELREVKLRVAAGGGRGQVIKSGDCHEEIHQNQYFQECFYLKQSQRLLYSQKLKVSVRTL